MGLKLLNGGLKLTRKLERADSSSSQAHRFNFCLLCKRRLTDSVSIERGYGPSCYQKVPAVITAQLEAAGQLRLAGIE